MAVGRNHDEIYVMVMREFGDRISRIAEFRGSFDLDTGKLCTECLTKLGANRLANCFRIKHDRIRGLCEASVKERLRDAQEGHSSVKTVRNRSHERCAAGSSFGKIDRKEDVPNGMRAVVPCAHGTC